MPGRALSQKKYQAPQTPVRKAAKFLRKQAEEAAQKGARLYDNFLKKNGDDVAKKVLNNKVLKSFRALPKVP